MNKQEITILHQLYITLDNDNINDAGKSPCKTVIENHIISGKVLGSN
jgi:hypothetical protein